MKTQKLTPTLSSNTKVDLLLKAALIVSLEAQQALGFPATCKSWLARDLWEAAVRAANERRVPRA